MRGGEKKGSPSTRLRCGANKDIPNLHMRWLLETVENRLRNIGGLKHFKLAISLRRFLCALMIFFEELGFDHPGRNKPHTNIALKGAQFLT
jgi:hypothetical protein